METLNQHNVAFLGFDKIQLLDLIGPLEAFAIANEALHGRPYQSFILSENKTFTSESRVTLASDYQLDNHPPIHTLIIPGGLGTRDPQITHPVRHWIDSQFDNIERVVSVCTGIFILADHAYLHGKEVVTHWGYANRLQQLFPALKVNHDRLFIRQGKFYSAAGVLSGIDLALHLIETDHSVDVAAYVAKYLVTYLKRSGNQSQFSEPLKFQTSHNSHLERINRWLVEHFSESVTVAHLAEQVHVSERHLNRLIKKHFNMSAGKYIEHIKLEQSKIYLTRNSASVEATSAMVGYTSPDAFRRSFKRKYGIAPHSYQLRFQ
jgi:transcriptional regulator GlxA family with amidase domain